VAALLEAHGVETVVLDAARNGLEAEYYQVDSISTSSREYEGHQAQEVTGEYHPMGNLSLAAGTVVVPMDQPLARVAFKLLEPRSDDGLVAWGLLDSRDLQADHPYPILRAAPGTAPRLGPPATPDRRRLTR
jgi:hypothetical protein